MPNWCDNYITITGEDASKIYDIIQSLPDDKGIMETLCTTDTPEYKELLKDNSFFSPFSVYFGTKWDFAKNGVDDISFYEKTITISVCTAWSPPLAFLEKLTKAYDVQARIEYFEGGMDFGGMAEFDDGKITSEIDTSYYEAKYLIDNDHFWEEITSDSFLEENSYDANLISQQLSFMTEIEVSELKMIINIMKEKKQ